MCVFACLQNQVSTLAYRKFSAHVLEGIDLIIHPHPHLYSPLLMPHHIAPHHNPHKRTRPDSLDTLASLLDRY